MNRFLAILALAIGVAACDSQATLKGAATDGETFAGTATANLTAVIPSGTLHLVGNRGTTCVGTYTYDSMFAGANAKLTYSCSNGESGEAISNRLTKTAEGNIGSRRVSFTYITH